MKLLVLGAGVLGSLYAARLHEAGHDVALLARGGRLRALREGGVRLAEGDRSVVRSVPVRVVEQPEDRYDLILVLVRTHQVEEALTSILEVEGDVLLLANWAAGPAPLRALLGSDRLLLGFPTQAGTIDGDVVHPRREGAATRLVTMPIGEPDGRPSARVDRVVAMFRAAGIRAGAEPRMDAWLVTHAAFETPLGTAVHEVGGTRVLAADPDRVRAMVEQLRRNLRRMPNGAVPRAFGLLGVLPVGVLVRVLRTFLRSGVSDPLDTAAPAAVAELERLAEQLRARER